MAEVTAELGALIQRTNFELFDFDYQVDDPNFKQEIEERVLDFYYDYEIGFATPDKFKRKFKARFLRAISYYNKLYNTTLLSYNPLINSKMSEALEQLSTATSNTTVEGSLSQDSTTNTDQTATGDSNTKASDYPQQPIAGGEFLNGESTTNNNSQTDSTTTATGTSTNNDTSTTSGENSTNYQKTIEGLTGTTYQELIQLERETIIRIPNMIIAELKPCFILVH
jgi:hypothetical protein